MDTVDHNLGIGLPRRSEMAEMGEMGQSKGGEEKDLMWWGFLVLMW